jgi:hypothetical protein
VVRPNKSLTNEYLKEKKCWIFVANPEHFSQAANLGPTLKTQWLQITKLAGFIVRSADN